MSAHERALKKKGGRVKIENEVKSDEKLDENNDKPKKPYKFVKVQGAKNNDSDMTKK